MKRRPFQLISMFTISACALINGAINTLPTHATAPAVEPNLLPAGREIDGVHYWSVDEMLEASQIIDNQRSTYCSGDKGCEEELSHQQMQEYGGIYRALDVFYNVHLFMTSINPNLGTMKLLYRDEDKMLSSMMGRTIRRDISKIYFVWVDESVIGDPYRDMSWISYGYRYPYHLGTEEETAPFTHTIIDESEADLGKGWFTPNVEREYDISSSSIADNAKQLIYYSYVDEEGGRSTGPINYSSCLASPDYVAGYDCRIMYDENGWYSFFPFDPNSRTSYVADEPVNPTNTDSQEPTPSPDTGSAPTTPTTDEDENTVSALTTLTTDTNSNTDSTPVTLLASEKNTSTDENNIAAVAEEKSSQLEPSSEPHSITTPHSPSAPNTGQGTIASSEKTIVFPWWLGVIIVVNGVILFRFFRPIRPKKNRTKGFLHLFIKNQKNSKNSVDKPTPVR